MIKKTNNKDVKKMREEVINLKKNLLNLNFQKSTGQLEKTSQIRKTRKDIARLKMEIAIKNGDLNA